MVKYSSRVGVAGNANQKKRGPPPKKSVNIIRKGGDLAIAGGMEVGSTVKEAIDSVKANMAEQQQIKHELREASDVGGKLAVAKKKAGSLSVGKGLTTGGGLTAGGDLTAGGNLTAGGDLFSDSLDDITNLHKVMPVKEGGALATSLQGVVDKMTHNGMIQVLQHMSPEQFHVLQGVSGSHLSQFNDHPLTPIARKVLGGSFTHPRNISKMATRDITRAVTAQQLSTALHAEMMDLQKGMAVGGGLLDSLKHGFKRAFDGLKSGVASGNRIGKVLHRALSTGIKIGQVFSPVVESIFPGAGSLIKTGISSAEALKAGLETGLRVGESLEKGLEGISELRTASPETEAEEVKSAEVIQELETAGATIATPQATIAQPPPQLRTTTQVGSGLSRSELRILGF